MPIDSDVDVRRPTRFQQLVISATEELDEILEAEGRTKPKVYFGKRDWKEGTHAPLIGWMHVGGSFTLEKNVVETGLGEMRSELGFRVGRARVALWHVSPEHVEHMLDRLWLATTRFSGGEAFRWQTAVYEYPTETEGPWLQNGHAVIVLSLPVELAVAGDYDGETVLVEVADTQVRTGIESPIDEAIGATAYEVNDWVVPKVTSES